LGLREGIRKPLENWKIMFNPKYRILLRSECFPPDEFICLGTQLISIVDSIKEFLPQHIWYGADVEATGNWANLEAAGKDLWEYNLNSFQLNVIGTDSQFIEYCSLVQQFIWGEFLCIDSNFSSQNIQNVELGTEGEQFRPITCDGVLLEIRAFDTTFFEIFAEDIELIKKLSKIYNVTIEYKLQPSADLYAPDRA
jgi:hypothetical protein